LLWYLHWLNGMEKHKVLVVVVAASRNTEIRMHWRRQPGSHDGTPASDALADFAVGWQMLDKDVTMFTCPVGIEIEGDIDTHAAVAFGDIKGSEVYPVLLTLAQMSQKVEDIIFIFERAYLDVE
jgi:hypothetical protein